MFASAEGAGCSGAPNSIKLTRDLETMGCRRPLRVRRAAANAGNSQTCKRLRAEERPRLRAGRRRCTQAADPAPCRVRHLRHSGHEKGPPRTLTGLLTKYK